MSEVKKSIFVAVNAGEEYTKFTFESDYHGKFTCALEPYKGPIEVRKQDGSVLRNRDNKPLYAVAEMRLSDCKEQDAMYPKQVILSGTNVISVEPFLVEDKDAMYYSFKLFTKIKNDETGTWDRSLWGTFHRLFPQKVTELLEKGTTIINYQPGARVYEIRYKELPIKGKSNEANLFSEDGTYASDPDKDRNFGESEEDYQARIAKMDSKVPEQFVGEGDGKLPF